MIKRKKQPQKEFRSIIDQANAKGNNVLITDIAKILMRNAKQADKDRIAEIVVCSMYEQVKMYEEQYSMLYDHHITVMNKVDLLESRIKKMLTKAKSKA